MHPDDHEPVTRERLVEALTALHTAIVRARAVRDLNLYDPPEEPEDWSGEDAE